MRSKVTRFQKMKIWTEHDEKNQPLQTDSQKNSYYKVHVWNRDRLLITIVNIFEELNKRENFSQNGNCYKYEDEINKKQQLQLRYQLIDLTEESKHK